MEMSSTVEQARNGCQKIDEMLKQKLLRANYDKSKYLIVGRGKRKSKMTKELEETHKRLYAELKVPTKAEICSLLINVPIFLISGLIKNNVKSNLLKLLC